MYYFQVKKGNAIPFHIMLRPAISVQLQQYQIEAVVGFYVGSEDTTEEKVCMTQNKAISNSV